MKPRPTIAPAIGLLVALLTGSTMDLAGQDARTLFERGTSHYRAGEFAEALAAYQDVLATGLTSAALHYNIGNCHFKLGDLGRALLHYERAAQLDPRDPDVRANLDLARSLTVDEINPLPRFWLVRLVEWWIHLLPRTWLVFATALTYVVTTGAAVVWILSDRSTVRRWMVRFAATTAALVVILGVSLLVRELRLGQAPYGIVLEAEVRVHSAPSDDRTLHLFTIHEGTKVRIDQQAGDWAEVVLPDGKVGWIRTTTYETI